MSNKMNDSKNTKMMGPGPRGGRGPGAHLGGPAEKAKDFKGTLKRLIVYLKPFSAGLVVIFILTIASTVFTILSPKITGKAITKIFEGVMAKFMKIPGAGIDFHAIFNILLLIGGLYIFSSIFSYIQQYIMAGISQKTVKKMRSDIMIKLNRLPLKFFDSKTHGEILSRVTNDIDNISITLQQSLIQVFSSIITIAGVIIMMLTISPLLTLITVLTLPLSILATAFIAKQSQKYFIRQQRVLGQLNGHVEEAYGGHVIIKTYNREKDSINQFQEVNKDLYEVGWKAQFLSGIIMPIMNFIGNIGYVLVAVSGGILVTKKAIEIGDIQAFIQYARQFTQPIIQVANIVNLIQSTIASAERVFEILDEKEEIPETQDPKTISKVKGDVVFNHIDFSYDPAKPLIENLTINVQSGQTIAIVGPTGAGKTTLVNLLMRFYELGKGKISIDGIPTTELTRSQLRKIFGMVLQDTWLFGGTIKDNIGYGKENATEEELITASKAAHAHHFISTLPEGYETMLNEETSNISTGEKQLITIARAFLANPDILILDEATSNVDTLTEINIQNAMQDLMKGRTNFVIAHRLSTIRNADLILVMNEGKIIETGSNEELLAKNGFYADLYKSQFQGAFV